MRSLLPGRIPQARGNRLEHLLPHLFRRGRAQGRLSPAWSTAPTGPGLRRDRCRDGWEGDWRVLGARYVSKQDHLTSLAYGVGLDARGSGARSSSPRSGLSLGILTQEVFSMVVVMAVVTSLAAPFALRAILRRIEPERMRLCVCKGPRAHRRLRRWDPSAEFCCPSDHGQSLLGGAQVIERHSSSAVGQPQSLAPDAVVGRSP